MVYERLAVLAARVLIGALFVAGAVQKVTDPQPVRDLLAGFGLPEILVWPAALYNLGAGAAVIAGRWIKPVAASLGAYSIVTSIFHFIPNDPWQMSIFVKNWAIAGGCFALSVAGTGVQGAR